MATMKGQALIDKSRTFEMSFCYCIRKGELILSKETIAKEYDIPITTLYRWIIEIGYENLLDSTEQQLGMRDGQSIREIERLHALR